MDIRSSLEGLSPCLGTPAAVPSSAQPQSKGLGLGREPAWAATRRR